MNRSEKSAHINNANKRHRRDEDSGTLKTLRELNVATCVFHGLYKLLAINYLNIAIHSDKCTALHTKLFLKYILIKIPSTVRKFYEKYRTF